MSELVSKRANLFETSKERKRLGEMEKWRNDISVSQIEAKLQINGKLRSDPQLNEKVQNPSELLQPPSLIYLSSS